MPESKERVQEFEFVENKRPEPMNVVIYRDIDDLGRVFVTEETLRRFHIGMPEYKIVLDTGVDIYEVRKEEALYIIDHANNSYAPYNIQYKSFDFDNELDDGVSNRAKGTKEKPIDEIQIFRDIEDSGRAFVTADVLKRFNVKKTGLTVYLNNMVVYEIDPVQAINIINNSNNEYAPYSIRYVTIEFDKEEDKSKGQIPYNDAVSTIQGPAEKKPEEEYIAGTSYKKPRPRKPGESEEHYIAFLEGYYDSVFKHEEELNNMIPGTNIKKPRVRDVYETDDAYVDYLREYYNRVFSPETREAITTRNLIKPRIQAEGESDDNYLEYLSLFYGTPVDKDGNPKHRR